MVECRARARSPRNVPSAVPRPHPALSVAVACRDFTAHNQTTYVCRVTVIKGGVSTLHVTWSQACASANQEALDDDARLVVKVTLAPPLTWRTLVSSAFATGIHLDHVRQRRVGSRQGRSQISHRQTVQWDSLHPGIWRTIQSERCQSEYGKSHSRN